MKTLATHVVFLALTRPPMMWGVTLDYFALCFVLVVLLWLQSGHLIYGILYVPLHLMGWLACKYDPHCFSVLFKTLSLPKNPNKSLWKVRCYEPF